MHGFAPGHDHPRGPGAWRAGRGGGPGRGRPASTELPSADDAASWFAGRLPDGWFTGAPQVSVDREEIVVVGTLPDLTDVPDDGGSPRGGDGPHQPVPRGDPRAAHGDRGSRPRPATAARSRGARRSAESSELFTSIAAPVMTRLRQPERQVLDTLVDAGRGAVPLGGAGLVGEAGGRARRRVARPAARRAQGRRGPAQRSLTSESRDPVALQRARCTSGGRLGVHRAR